MMILGFLLVLGPLVTIHELGHYLVGRWCGVKAEAFSIGFGRELAGWTDRRGTRWKLSLLPLGGYVQFAGDMNPAGTPSQEWLDLPEAERAQTFQAHPLWQRALIVLAGPLTNLLFALAIFAAFFMTVGKPQADAVVGDFTEHSAAQAAGMKQGDRILTIDGDRIGDFFDVQQKTLMFPGKRIVLVLDRSGERITLPVTIGATELTDDFGNKQRTGMLGVYFKASYMRLPPLAAGVESVRQTDAIVGTMVTGLWQIVTQQRSVKELGGPVKIAQYSGESLSQGPLAFVWFVALISINLAFINLLPIPALDGGHLAFYAAEAVRRRPVGQRSQEWAFRTGVAFVLALMLFVTFNDIASLPLFGR
ncbi:MAG: RIP metalloprotease RseP [Novosphingobium sp.]|nr:RIP metalloprotease RseP [Novosphingobium sp.]